MTTPPSPRHTWLTSLQSSLLSRQQQHLHRHLREVQSTSPDGTTLTIDNTPYLQFCTNNYLGLAAHPALINAASAATATYGTGAGASRLVAGSLALHHELEAALARLKNTEAALLFPTGFMANLAVLTTFAQPGDAIVSDKLNHASLLDAAQNSGADHRTFPHKYAARAEALLARHAGATTRWLVTDSIFSMDGDTADLPALCDTADRTNSLVFIDEAHATGVLGARGAGLAELQNVEHKITLTVGTLSKALGSLGGFVAGPKLAIDALINTARSFIYTTALPPACAAAALAALHIIDTEPQRRARLLTLAQHVKHSLIHMGYNCGNPTDPATPILPVILGDSGTALAAAEKLKAAGLFVPAIRPPTVPPNTARLRISLMATHTDTQIERLLDAMGTLKNDTLLS